MISHTFKLSDWNLTLFSRVLPAKSSSSGFRGEINFFYKMVYLCLIKDTSWLPNFFSSNVQSRLRPRNQGECRFRVSFHREKCYLTGSFSSHRKIFLMLPSLCCSSVARMNSCARLELQQTSGRTFETCKTPNCELLLHNHLMDPLQVIRWWRPQAVNLEPGTTAHVILSQENFHCMYDKKTTLTFSVKKCYIGFICIAILLQMHLSH